jgi:hypothetical protein
VSACGFPVRGSNDCTVSEPVLVTTVASFRPNPWDCVLLADPPPASRSREARSGTSSKW